MTRLVPLALVAAIASLPAAADDLKPAAKDGSVPLFNGRDLSGWVNVNCAPGTFAVKGDEIVTTGNPTGFLRTDRQYENFELEFEWMHVEPTRMANSGLFVWGDPLPAVGTPYTRGIEVQVLINYAPPDRWATSHGDLFSIWGAKCVPDRPHPKGIERCLPSEDRVKGAGQWNHYKVVANDGVIKLSVNGKEVSGVSKCSPRKGYLALESEGAECHFRNLLLKELPTTNPKPDEVAKVAEGHVSLFTGLDLKGWSHQTRDGKPVDGGAGWKAAGGKLVAGGEHWLGTNKEYARYDLRFDFKTSGDAADSCSVKVNQDVRVSFSPSGAVGVGTAGGGWVQSGELDPPATDGKVDAAWHRARVTCDGKTWAATFDGRRLFDWPVTQDPPAGTVRFAPTPGVEVMNVFVKDRGGE